MAALSLVPAASPSAKPEPRTLGEHIASVEDIAATIEQLADDEMPEERREELARALIDALAGTRAKVDRVASALAMFEHLAASAAAERDRLARRAERYMAHAERLTNYVLAVLDAASLDRLEGETSTLARRHNPPKVQIDDEATIPWEFFRLPAEAPPPEAAPDKKAIAAALKADPASVPGARLVRSVKLVRS